MALQATGGSAVAGWVGYEAFNQDCAVEDFENALTKLVSDTDLSGLKIKVVEFAMTPSKSLSILVGALARPGTPIKAALKSKGVADEYHTPIATVVLCASASCYLNLSAKKRSAVLVDGIIPDALASGLLTIFLPARIISANLYAAQAGASGTPGNQAALDVLDQDGGLTLQIQLAAAPAFLFGKASPQTVNHLAQCYNKAAPFIAACARALISLDPQAVASAGWIHMGGLTNDNLYTDQLLTWWFREMGKIGVLAKQEPAEIEKSRTFLHQESGKYHQIPLLRKVSYAWARAFIVILAGPTADLDQNDSRIFNGPPSVFYQSFHKDIPTALFDLDPFVAAADIACRVLFGRMDDWGYEKIDLDPIKDYMGSKGYLDTAVPGIPQHKYKQVTA